MLRLASPMPKLTALIHTCNDAQRLGRALESLRPCDELLVVDHGSLDDTVIVAREYGARFLAAASERANAVGRAQHDWLLALLPSEALSEALEASLFEWKLAGHDAVAAFSVALREQAVDQWLCHPPTTRLVNRTAGPWAGELPP